jgi:hypothetical protein
MIKTRTLNTISPGGMNRKNLMLMRRLKSVWITLIGFLCLLIGLGAHAQQRTISGKVTGKEDGAPIIGATVTLKGTSTNAQTDIKGTYVLRLPAGTDQIIIVSYIGYSTQEVVVDGKTTLDIVLNPDLKQLQEVVVSGYTSQNKKDFTGSATRVSAAQLENRPVQSFDQALAGQATGVSIVQPSGVLNNPPVFRIRGFNSISLTSYPLIIIDGVAAFTGSLGNAVANNRILNQWIF